MPYHIDASEARPASSTSPGWLRQALPASLGDCSAQRFEVDEGLAIVYSRYRPIKDLVEESHNPKGPRTLVITLGLSGQSMYTDMRGDQLEFRAGHTTVTSFNGNAGQRRYQAASSVAQLRLLIAEPVLHRYLGASRDQDLLATAGVRRLGFGKTSSASAAHARALISGLTTPVADVLGMHIHALGLLAEQLRQLAPVAEHAAHHKISPEDIARMEQVRDLMQAQMQHPLSIAYLCATVGLSEFKLKQACRHLYNASPHRLLLEIRMRRAWVLLESGYQVAQVAWQVGYEHPSNFSAAFTRFYGRTPKAVFAKRN
ncbi:helix-turn-helix transcriptional regulator [Undibacterium sp. JH2W]|uniref:helix-turn-helix transcriptional regulator n=1 Tax=Undibacterium sp. JH2W TaxID=3413037 RepID=UPI003BF00370